MSGQGIAGLTRSQRTSEILFEELMAESKTDGRRETLGRVREACDALEKEQSKIGKQSVANWIKSKHPKLPGGNGQYLRNAANKGLGRYIDARETERSQSADSSPSTPDAALEKLLRTGGNRELSIMVGFLRERAKAAERQLERARHLFATMRPGADLDAVLSDRPSAVTQQSHMVEAPPEALSALRLLLGILSDEKTLASFNLARDPNGRVRRNNLNGRGPFDELFPATLVLGMESLANHLDPSRKDETLSQKRSVAITGTPRQPPSISHSADI